MPPVVLRRGRFCFAGSERYGKMGEAASEKKLIGGLFVSEVRLEVCICCALKEQHIAGAVARIRSQHGERVEIVERKCLDVCKEYGAVKLGEEVMLIKPGDEVELEERVKGWSDRRAGL